MTDKQKHFDIIVECHVEGTGTSDDPYIEICDSVMVAEKEIEIPSGCTVTICRGTTKTR